jgi:hypothetical protein
VAALGDIVAISIGPDKKLYNVHKDLICHHSEYFRTAYNGRWQESEKGVALEDVEHEVFSVFLHWLYVQRLPDTVANMRMIIGAVAENPTMRRNIDLVLLKSCVFGDRFLASAFKRDTHNHYVTWRNCFPPWYEHVTYAFENLKEDDPMLSFIVDMQCIVWNPIMDEEDEVSDRDMTPQKFWVRVMLRNFELKKSFIAQNNTNLCSYHCHESDEERDACPQNSKPKAEA